MVRPSRRSLVLAASALLPAAGSWWGAAAAFSSRDRTYTSGAQAFRVEAPSGWTLSVDTGFPSIRVLLVHPDGASMSITASATTARTAAELVEQNRPGFAAAGLAIVRQGPGARGSVELVVRPVQGGEVVRQAYFVRPFSGGTRQAVIVTLTAGAGVLAAKSAAFDQVVKRLTFLPPPEDPADGGSPG